LNVAEKLLLPATGGDGFVQTTFKGLYFTDLENKFIDNVRTNVKRMRNPYYRAIAMAALIRACIKKRPRGIFTYVGARYDDGRNDLKMSFRDQFLAAVQKINGAVFDNGKHNQSRWGDALTVRQRADLVYMDPPYFSELSDNEYVRRYHFVEGLARGWDGVEIQSNTLTKKFKSYPTPFSSRTGAADAFDRLFYKYRDSALIVSYSSNSLPTLQEMIELMGRHKKHVDVVSVAHRYSFANQNHTMGRIRNDVQEYLFVGY
jgi:DNA adenine methylase